MIFFYRWLGKGIYYLKLSLLATVFPMSEEEKDISLKMATFASIIYSKYWYEAPLPLKAAQNDIEMFKLLKQFEEYFNEDSNEAEDDDEFEDDDEAEDENQDKAGDNNVDLVGVLSRHSWYLTQQLVIVGLCNTDLKDEIRELMAAKLFNSPRTVIKMGKPKFPDMTKPENHSLANLVGSNSWLIFDILSITDIGWLQIPCKHWSVFDSYKKFQSFVENIVTVNDLAERGVATISRFNDNVRDESDRQDLIQVVDEYRRQVPDLSKESLSKHF